MNAVQFTVRNRTRYARVQRIDSLPRMARKARDKARAIARNKARHARACQRLAAF